jgi:hypothetical protein
VLRTFFEAFEGRAMLKKSSMEGVGVRQTPPTVHHRTGYSLAVGRHRLPASASPDRREFRITSGKLRTYEKRVLKAADEE